METKVILHAAQLRKDQAFPIEQATEMLKINPSGWELKDPKFKLKDGAIIRNNTGQADQSADK